MDTPIWGLIWVGLLIAAVNLLFHSMGVRAGAKARQENEASLELVKQIQRVCDEILTSLPQSRAIDAPVVVKPTVAAPSAATSARVRPARSPSWTETRERLERGDDGPMQEGTRS